MTDNRKNDETNTLADEADVIIANRTGMIIYRRWHFGIRATLCYFNPHGGMVGGGMFTNADIDNLIRKLKGSTVTLTQSLVFTKQELSPIVDDLIAMKNDPRCIKEQQQWEEDRRKDKSHEETIKERERASQRLYHIIMARESK